MNIGPLDMLTGLSTVHLDAVVERIAGRSRMGRPWSCSLRRRVQIVCAALRTNLTVRERAAVFRISKSSAHRIVATLVPKLASMVSTVAGDWRWSWVVDGTLIPTRDHSRAARSKNYRWSCNAQVLARRQDLRIIATSAGGPGHRNDPIHYRGTAIEGLCKQHGRVLADGGYRGVPELVTPIFQGRSIVRDRAWRRHRRRRARIEHAIARLKDWRVLRDHRRRGAHLDATVRAVAFLHNLRLDLRDKS